jgi:hypothetical protein
MSHSHNSDDGSTPQQPTNAPTTDKNSGNISGWTDPAYSVALSSLKHLFFKPVKQRTVQQDFSVPDTAQPNVVPTNNPKTTQTNNQAGESANSAGQTMIKNSSTNNSNTNNILVNKPNSVEQIQTESHGVRDIVFSENFKFKPTLLSIFWKTDKDSDQRLSKSELSDAMSNGQYHGDEELILCLLWRHFDDIRRRKIMASTFFDVRGISIEEIEAFEGWLKYLPQGSINNMSTGPKTFRKPPLSIRPHGK